MRLQARKWLEEMTRILAKVTLVEQSIWFGWSQKTTPAGSIFPEWIYLATASRAELSRPVHHLLSEDDLISIEHLYNVDWRLRFEMLSWCLESLRTENPIDWLLWCATRMLRVFGVCAYCASDKERPTPRLLAPTSSNISDCSAESKMKTITKTRISAKRKVCLLKSLKWY